MRDVDLSLQQKAHCVPVNGANCLSSSDSGAPPEAVLQASRFPAEVCIISSLLLHVVRVVKLSSEPFHFLVVIGASVSFFPHFMPVSINLVFQIH